MNHAVGRLFLMMPNLLHHFPGLRNYGKIKYLEIVNLDFSCSYELIDEVPQKKLKDWINRTLDSSRHEAFP